MPTAFPKPPFEPQPQAVPGSSSAMRPQPDYGEDTYRGAGRLNDKKVLLTGGDSGIGRAVALAYAREGADLVVSYLNEHEDAAETKRLVEEAGRQCLLVAGDISKAEHCRSLVQKTVEAFGRIDVLVNNAAHQMSFNSLEEISDEEWDLTFATNISAMFYITKAAVPHMKPGSSIINTASVNADSPSPQLLAMLQLKAPSRTLRGAWPNCLRNGASALTRWPPVLFGRL
jgi:NAD(P)-dependent dehydrogenase (short-subunit alcohol dehydrogenase family)